MRRETVVVTDLFGALRGMLRPLLRNPSVELVFDAALDVPAVVTDGAKVSQILRNLISNALKFTERGEVRVGARATGAGTVEFSVTDTGCGIAPDDLPTIFEEFAQIAPARGSSGLGLPLARRFAELLGGQLRVVSTPGVGSTFTLALPNA